MFFDRPFLCSIRIQSESPSLLIEPGLARAGAAGAVKVALYTLSAPPWPYFDGFEPTLPASWVGATIEAARFRARFDRPRPCIR